MAVHKSATEQLSGPMSFRHLRSRREILEAFMRADGKLSLTPILREAVDVYIDWRLRGERHAPSTRQAA